MMLFKKNISFILLALLAFLGLCAEFVLMLIERHINGIDIAQFSVSQLIQHWQIIIPVWLIVSILVILLSKRLCSFNVFEPHSTPSRWQLILGVVLPVIFAVVLSIISGGPGFVRTFKAASSTFFTLQYVYYLLEMLLSGLIISLSQQAITVFSGKQNMFPWGGLILGLTWGLGHYITKGDVFIALIAFVLAIFFGLIYNLTGRDLKKAWPLMYLVFACFG